MTMLPRFFVILTILSALAFTFGLACGGDDDDDDDVSNDDDADDDTSDDDTADDDTADDDDDDDSSTKDGCALTMPETGNLVADPSFENPDAGANWVTYTAGKMLGAWESTGDGVDHMGTVMQAGEGDQCVDLNNLNQGGLKQTLTTEAGQAYALEFCYAGNPSYGTSQGVKETEIFWGETSLGVFKYDTTGDAPDDVAWVTISVDIPASATTGASTTLSFVSKTGTPYGPAIDAVVVTAK
ncbi:MAG: DUF642 domain-containing protein [Deltaproteobacteria bacterium]|nr:DUF642 domain-containing protein [Deltaproteobacteria bacterium]MCB9487601.1 DUF642 domain-containing protein [Deltaproteobacteria bacterium]